MANTKMYWLHTLSPTHIGTGRGVGYIDLPVHRDKVTNWPVIPGSAFKGVWADFFRATDARRNEDSNNGRLLRAAFGRAGDDTSNAGALIPTDARLVCLPVRSFQGTFAWCTSALALAMLQRDLQLAEPQEALPTLTSEKDKVRLPKESALKQDNQVYLEDLNFPLEDREDVHEWGTKIAGWVFPGKENEAWRDIFVKRFAVLPDTVFDFLTTTGTEVVARVKIDDDLKTVVDGALWNEESLPAETILAGFVTCDRVYYGKEEKAIPEKELLNHFAGKAMTLQIGGKATVGRGRVRCVFNGGGQ